jgi:AcrR family transcriptional regulator
VREGQIARTRESILDAALRVFARDGYQDAAMSAIAAEAGYTAPSLYNYFSSKEQIFEALTERMHHDFSEPFERVEPDGLMRQLPFRQRLALLVREQFRLADRHRDGIRLLHAINSGGGSMPNRVKCEQVVRFRGYLEQLGGWLADAGRDVDWKGRSIEDLTFFLFGVSQGFLVHWMLDDKAPRMVDRVDLVVDLFLDGALGTSTATATASATPTVRSRRPR